MDPPDSPEPLKKEIAFLRKENGHLRVEVAKLQAALKEAYTAVERALVDQYATQPTAPKPPAILFPTATKSPPGYGSW